jgi:ADP-ribosylglycohydrolase
VVKASESILIDRAMGALIGGALGDALGMPTQLLTAPEIKAEYGFVDRFLTPSENHPVSKGLPAGAITDDTEQTILLGHVLAASPDGFDHRRWVAALVEWERDVKARGGYDLLGPSTKRAIDLINEGVAPEEAGRDGQTNGAAMRIAPVGIMMPPRPLKALVAKVAESCAATHGTSIAVSAASAVAAAVSVGIDGADWREAAELAVQAAYIGQKHLRHGPEVDMASLIERARDIVRGKGEADAIAAIAAEVGTGVDSRESVPAAFAVLEIAAGDPWRAAVISANLGGDTDTIGAIAAGMAGARAGYSRLPPDRVRELVGIDLDDVHRLAVMLVARRRASSSGGKDAAA